jgi:hypothetical protein
MSGPQRKNSNKKSKLNQEKLTEEANNLLDEIRNEPLSKKSKKQAVSEEEDEEAIDLKKLTKKQLIERLEHRNNQNLCEESTESSEEEEEKKKKTKLKPLKAEKKTKSASSKTPLLEECDAIAIEYSIPSDKHPFHHLDGQYASVELEQVFDLEKEDVEKNKIIQFIKSIGDEHILVEAIITSDKVFKVPKKKAGKFIVGTTNMTDNFEARNQSIPCTSSSTKSDNLVDFMTSLLEAAAKNGSFLKTSSTPIASPEVLVNKPESANELRETSDEEDKTISKFVILHLIKYEIAIEIFLNLIS